MRAGPSEGSVVACQGHGDEADGYGAGFGCEGEVLAVVYERKGEEGGGDGDGTFLCHDGCGCEGRIGKRWFGAGVGGGAGGFVVSAELYAFLAQD